MATCIKCLLPICMFVAILTIVFAKPPPEEQEPFDCPLNEVYHKCDIEVCYKTCEHLKRHPACPSVYPGCYKPACLCVKDTLRDSTGKCVPFEKCSNDTKGDDQPLQPASQYDQPPSEDLAQE